MSLFRESVAALHAGLMAAGGEVGVYRRNGQDAIDALPFVWGNTRHAADEDEALTVTSRMRDAIVWAGELAHLGEPRRGDELDWIDDAGGRHTYQVLPRDDDRVFRPTDQTGQLLRVYLVEIAPNSEQQP